MEDGWTKFCITSIVFECIAFLVVYFIGLNSREKELLRNAVVAKVLARFRK